MNKIMIRRPAVTDQEQLNDFFRLVVTDTFAQEGLADWTEDIEEEIETKRTYLKMDLDSNGQDRYFLIALYAEQIVGCIEYGRANEVIRQTDKAFEDIVEVGTVFVHLDYRRQGMANQLLEHINSILRKKGIKEFCLDSGYKNAQQVWKKKFGEPDHLLKDYWGKGFDHSIWRIHLSALTMK